MTRAERRHHAERAKVRAKSFYGGWMCDERQLGIAARSPKQCSCWCCGNPRRHFELPTIQELRAEEGAKLAERSRAEAA